MIRWQTLSLAACALIAAVCLGCAPKPSFVYTEAGITKLRQITSDRSFELDTAWSRDGTRIAFSSDRGGSLELWAIPMEGGGIQQITSSSAFSVDVAPHWSPDDSEIAFQSNRVTAAPNIWKITLGNRGLTQLTNNPNGSFSPKWSPNGKKIAFTGKDKNGEPYIWTMGANGEDPTQLGPGAGPCWSPDGERIAFGRETSKGNYDIWMMNSDGTDPRQLTTQTEKQELSPAWSPDGEKIAYVVQYTLKAPLVFSEGKVKKAILERSEIWVMDIWGKNQTQLTAFSGINISPCWSPDGKTICFISSRGDSWDIWSMVPLAK